VAEEGFMKIARACKQEANLDSVKTWLSCKEHWLLIIDNADDPTVDVPRLIPSGIKGSVLITTRNPDVQNFASAGSYRVDEMSPEDATALLLKTTALQNIEETEKVLARNVVETLGYLALAIIQAGAVIRQRLIGLDGFCELYSTRKKELLESGRPDDSIDYQRSVYTTWEISIRMIKEMRDSDKHAIFALELLRLFSFMHFDGIRAEIFKQARHNPDPWYENCFFERSLLVQLMPDGWDQMFWGQALKLLVSFSLITVNESNCIAMHPLVHEWSRDRMSEQDLEEGWKTAAMTLAMSTTFERRVSDHKQRKLLLPHMDACLSYSNGQLFSPGPDIHERLVAALKFCMANRESCRAKALDLSLETKKCMEAIYPPDSYSRLNIMLFVAEDMSELGRYAEATDAYQRLLTTLTDLKDPFPNLTVAVTNAVAAKHLELGDPKKAIDMCLEARNKFQPVLGVDDPNFLASLNVIGKAKLAMGSSRDGIKYLEQAYEGSMRTYGEHHTFTLEVMDFLADAYREDGKYKQARAMQTKFVAMLLESYGPDNPRTILEKARLERFRRVRVGVGSILRRKREIAEMEELLATSKGTLGETHTKTLLCLSQLAWNYFQCGAFEKAWLLQEDVVKISTEKWGADSENTEFAVKRLRQIRISIVLRKIFYWWLPKRMLEEDGMWKC
jgi:tetratricopeptide (TPR) repeat protein